MKAAVLGHPIAHSLSPVLHRAAYEALGLDWQYTAIDVTAEHLGGFVAGLGDDWAGLSLTMPLKQAVLPLLDERSRMVDRVGGANTVVLTQGRRIGHNTDVLGMIRALEEAAGGAELGSVGVIGAGATASAALVAADLLGAGEVLLAARRIEASAALAGDDTLALQLPVQVHPWADLAPVFACDAVIVTLPGDAGAALRGLVPAHPGVLLDVTYDPWPTTLAAAWTAAGGALAPGHRMLLWQAVAQVELMTNRAAPITVMSAALDAALTPA